MKHIVLSLAVFALTGCSALVPSAVARLYQVSPLEADPADLAVALVLPDTLDVKSRSAKITFVAERADTGETSNGVYTLRVRSGDGGQTVFDIADADRDDLRRQQTLIRGWKQTSGDATSGSVSVTFEGCSVGAGPSQDDTVSVLLRTQADGDFFTLVRNASVADALDVLELTTIDPC
ncbi:hypothetical protein C8N43_2666 [Litoreibacter ponti]|uniref:Lipoprotein n=1 Tax=Litoreibacter ponti TaxID=1510457 RepID=A0A2T6BPJ1_9RHOB|nr:hypothetical protein [Litoreibacter ponti]PTX57991.1 hypothetical protein C8N43_2666 [Litoreibacter ponti]